MVFFCNLQRNFLPKTAAGSGNYAKAGLFKHRSSYFSSSVGVAQLINLGVDKTKKKEKKKPRPNRKYTVGVHAAAAPLSSNSELDVDWTTASTGRTVKLSWGFAGKVLLT